MSVVLAPAARGVDTQRVEGIRGGHRDVISQFRSQLVVRRVLGNLVADARAERGRALASQSKLQESLAKTKQRLSAVLADLVRPSLPSTPCTPPTSYLFHSTPGGDGTCGPKRHHTV